MHTHKHEYTTSHVSRMRMDLQAAFRAMVSHQIGEMVYCPMDETGYLHQIIEAMRTVMDESEEALNRLATLAEGCDLQIGQHDWRYAIDAYLHDLRGDTVNPGECRLYEAMHLDHEASQ